MESQSIFSLPADFCSALRQSGLEEFFLDCAYVHRAGYLSWIGACVRAETRREKIQEALHRLAKQRAEEMNATSTLAGESGCPESVRGRAIDSFLA